MNEIGQATIGFLMSPCFRSTASHTSESKASPGPPLVCVEIKSPNDESYDKMPYYARLGVPEAWVIDCDTKKPEVFMLESGEYKTRSADAEGWMRSECVGLRMKEVDGKLWVLFDGDREHVVLPE